MVLVGVRSIFCCGFGRSIVGVWSNHRPRHRASTGFGLIVFTSLWFISRCSSLRCSSRVVHLRCSSRLRLFICVVHLRLRGGFIDTYGLVDDSSIADSYQHVPHNNRYFMLVATTLPSHSSSLMNVCLTHRLLKVTTRAAQQSHLIHYVTMILSARRFHQTFFFTIMIILARSIITSSNVC